MARRVVSVSAPCRLHFGLLPGEDATGRRFGGAGVMLAWPRLTLRAEPASAWRFVGPLADRAAAFAEAWRRFHAAAGVDFAPGQACQVEVLAAPAEHVGLGVGTQLGMAVAQALVVSFDLPAQTPWELAASVGRGARSAIGAHGFCGGGLLVDRGKRPGEALAPLDCRQPLPEHWRFVLARPAGEGLSGAAETAVFQQPPRAAPGSRAELIRRLREELLPAAAAGDFAAFGESLYEYGRASGLAFAEHQGGAYNGPVLTALVAALRDLGARGVGQSSWGPTVFALAEHEEAARALAARLRAAAAPLELAIDLGAPDNQGALVKAAPW